MPKLAPRLLVAVENAQTWRTLSRVATNSHDVIRATTEAQIREQLAQPIAVAAIVVEPLIGRQSGLKALDLAREAHPQALRVVVSNFSDISLLIEGVHNALVQRILGMPLEEAELRAVLAGAWSTTGFNFPRPAMQIPA
jgi:ActR/RegA family two-component response regulator